MRLGVRERGAGKRVVEDGGKGRRIGGGPDPTYRATVGGLGDDAVLRTVVVGADSGEVTDLTARTRCSARTRGYVTGGARLARRVCSGADLVVRSAGWAVAAPSAAHVALIRVAGESETTAVAVLAGRARRGAGVVRVAGAVDVRSIISLIVLSREVDQGGRGRIEVHTTAPIGGRA